MYSYLFLALVTPPIYFIDRRFGVNYFFLMYPTKDSPLEWIFDITGEKLYPAGLIFLVTVTGTTPKAQKRFKDYLNETLVHFLPRSSF